MSCVAIGALAAIVGLIVVTVAPASAQAATVIFLESGTSWTVPSDWNNSSNTIECVGAGGTGNIGAGGSGGGYAKRSNVTLTPGGNVGYAVGTASTTLGSAGTDTWFSSTSVLECAGGDSGNSSHGDVTHAGGAGGGSSSTHDGPGGGGAGGPNGAGAAGGNTSGTTEMYAGAGGAGDNGHAAGGAGGVNHEMYSGNAQGGNGSSEAVWTQTSDGSVAGPGGGGGGSGSNFPNAAKKGGSGGSFGGGSGAPGRGSPDVSSNVAGEPGIIVITYTPGTPTPATSYTYDANGRLTCAATPDGYFSSYVLDYSDNRTLVVRNKSACTTDQSQLPVPHNVSATVFENSGNNYITLHFTGGTPISVAVQGSAAHGMATAQGATIYYQPTNGYSGSDTFQYSGHNGQGTSINATVTVTVTPVPVPPTVSPVMQSVAENSSGNAIILSIGGGAPQSVNVSTQATNGVATATGTSITYSPHTGFTGTDYFDYTATNLAGTSAPALATIMVTSGAPTAGPFTTSVNENSSQNPMPLVLGGGPAQYVTVSTAASNGLAKAMTGTTQINYTPNAGFVGTDHFQYTASNPSGTSAPAVATVVVNLIPPVAGTTTANIAENSSMNLIPLNIGGGTAQYANVATGPSHGTAWAISGTTQIYYTPNANFIGSDSFTYTATNSAGTSPAGPVNLNVQFAPVTHTYISGTSVTETVPAGASQAVITVDGGGGGGACKNGGGGAPASGGGGSGEAVKTIAVTGGNTFTYTVGAGGAGGTGCNANGSPGGASTVSGGTINLTGGGGGGGIVGGSGGAGGTASGGDTNPSGSAGAIGTSGGQGGAAASGAGANTAPGGGGNGQGAGVSGDSGATGQVKFSYS